MTSQHNRLLLWSGCLGSIVFFIGDMLYYGGWGPGNFSTDERMAHVALWRLHFGSITGPVGTAFNVLGSLGLWYCCRRAAPRAATTMLAGLYALNLFGELQHGIFGPLGFAIRDCGQKSEAVAQIGRLNSALMLICLALFFVGYGIWILLALRKEAGVPRWTVLLCPLVTFWLLGLMVHVPDPLGLPLAGGWTNIAGMTWFAVLAVTALRSDNR